MRCLGATASVGIVLLAAGLANEAWASTPLRLAGQTAAPAAAKPAAKPAVLEVSISGMPRSITRGHPAALTVRVSNLGRRATRGRVTVTASAGKGLSIPRNERRLTIAALKAGQSRTLRMRVTLNASSARLTVRASAAHARAASRSIVLKAQGRRAPANPLVGTFWWTSTTPNPTGIGPDHIGALYFVNSTTVYSGIPDGALPSRCTPSRALNASQPIDQQSACVSYVYDSATGVLTIGGKAAGVYANGKLTLATSSATATQLTIESAGFTTSGQFAAPITGCPPTVFCVNYFGLASTGQYYFGDAAPPSTDPSTWPAAVPYDELGTYTVNAHGSITLHPVGGTTKTDTFAYIPRDANGVSGVILNAVAFVTQ